MTRDAASGRKRRSLLAALVLVPMLVISGTIITYFYLHQPPSATQTATSGTHTTTPTGAIVTATMISSGLNLVLMLNATHLMAGQAVNATADVRNPSPSASDVRQAWVWPSLPLRI